MTPLEHARSNFQKAENYHAALNPSLDIIWRNNVQMILEPIINEAKSEKEVMFLITRFACYDFTCTQPLLEPGVQWYARFLSSLQIRLPFEESELIPDERCVLLNDKRVSTDFLYRLSKLASLTRKGVNLQGQKTVLEIGGGYGAFARTIMGANPKIKYVMVDIPETLFFAEVFLRHSFPDKTFGYLVKDEYPEDCDILFVPVGLERRLNHRAFDLAINTNSLGEMPRHIAKRWIDWLVQIKPLKVFSLNRFLNSTPEDVGESRKQASGSAFLWGPEWKIEQWEVNPPYERCPHYMSIVTRNLHMVASLDPTWDEQAIRKRLTEIGAEDWNIRPYWDDFILKFGGDRAVMAKGWPDLTPDLTMTGSLFTLWDARRHGIEVDGMLKGYLELLSRGAEPFEEMDSLRAA
jgi:hypothetical protein